MLSNSLTSDSKLLTWQKACGLTWRSTIILNCETILDSAAFLQVSLNKLLKINLTMHQITIPQSQCHPLAYRKHPNRERKWFFDATPSCVTDSLPRNMSTLHRPTNFLLVTLPVLITLQAINLIIRLLLHIMPPFLIINSPQHDSGPFFHFLCVNLFTPIWTDIVLLSYSHSKMWRQWKLWNTVSYHRTTKIFTCFPFCGLPKKLVECSPLCEYIIHTILHPNTERTWSCRHKAKIA